MSVAKTVARQKQLQNVEVRDHQSNSASFRVILAKQLIKEMISQNLVPTFWKNRCPQKPLRWAIMYDIQSSDES